jgi:hypothetical protein
MKAPKTFIYSLLIITLVFSTNAQQVNSIYFMKNNPIRSDFNPAFQPINDFYFSMPLVGFTQFDLSNTSLTLKDIFYKYNGQTITFLHPNGSVDKFYSFLQPNTVIQSDLQTNILSFGFRKSIDYWSFSLSEKADGMIGIPRDIFKFILYGTTESNKNSFNFTPLETDFTIYTEAAFGYSHYINKRLSIGGKLKFLYGTANFSNTNINLTLNANNSEWSLNGSGSANISSPLDFNIGDHFQSISYNQKSSWFQPSGIGAGIDLGINFKYDENIHLSASIIDLGFINWFSNAKNINYGINYSFNGVKQFDGKTITSVQNIYTQFPDATILIDSLLTTLKAAPTLSQTKNSYITYTSPKLNLGFEYNILDNKLSFGLLSRTQLFNKIIAEEVTVSANAKPVKWFNATLSYSLFEGQFSSIGMGLGIRTGFIHWFASADYIPLEIAKFSNIPIPYNSKAFNIALGINIVVDKPRRRMLNMQTGLYNRFKSDD